MLKKLILSMKNPQQWVLLLICLTVVLIGGGISLVKDNGNPFGIVLIVLGSISGIFGICFVVIRNKDL